MRFNIVNRACVASSEIANKEFVTLPKITILAKVTL